MDEGPQASERTAPTIAAAKFDEQKTAVTPSAASEPGQDKPTVPLTPPDVDSLERTEGGEGRPEVSEWTEEDRERGADRDQTADQTEATVLGRPTDAGGQQRPATGKHAMGGATRARRGRVARVPDKIAGYEILGELGRGGMGVVYKARQIGLNRLCALKMILAGGLASADAIARFKIEAEAIAHLQHPNIVQVYDIGEADDCPYFSLEFVEGSNLQNKIAATPQPPGETARLMQQICEGVHAAHQRGVLHRDLKPANVLLTKDNVPKITDFGLAKRIEEKDHGQTRTGAILGTPSYMAPEQAMGRAKDVGPAADIYSLGAVLYDMLTGRPPFRGETVMDTLNQVQKLEPLPPRDLAPKIPLDLQTICLKALQKDPKKRYATAGEMAEDFRRFLANEPILARPTPAWERGVKWAKRRPALATAISVSSVAVISVLVFGGLWLNDRAQAAEKEKDQQADLARVEKLGREEAERLKKLADDQRDVATQQRNLAGKHFKQAQQAVDEMLTRVGGPELRYEPRTEQVRQDLLKKALGFYLEFLRDRGTDPELRYDTALADLRVAYVSREFGKYEEALKHYQLALERLSELEREQPKELKYRQAVAASILERAVLWHLQNRFPESEKGYRQGLELLGQLVKEHPDDLDQQDELANSYDNLASLCVTLGRFQEAKVNYDQALGVRSALTAKDPKNPELRKRLVRLERNRAVLFVKVGNLSEAEKSLVAARDIARALTRDVPGVPDYSSEYAESSMNLAICYRKLGKPQLAVDALHEAIALLELLKTDYPRTPEYHEELARAHYELGMVHGEQGQVQRAHDQLVKALQIQERLLAEQPNLAAIRLQLAKSNISLGIALVHLEELDKALDHYRRGVALLEMMKPAASSSPDECDELARGHENLAFLLTALKKPVEADQSWERLLRLRQELVTAFPESLDRHGDLAATDTKFAFRFEQAGKAPEALTHWKDAAVQFAQCMVLVDKDTTRADHGRNALMKDFGDKALAALQRAVGVGFRDGQHLKTAPEYRLLRERPEFQRLVGEMEGKKEN